MAASARILARDPTAAVEVHLPDDRFVPIRAADLAAALAADVAARAAHVGDLRPVFAAIAQIVAEESLALERDLLDRYAPFNPDRDTLPPPDAAAAATPAAFGELLRGLDYTFDKANFEQLSDGQVERVADAARIRGFRVRLHADRVEHVAIWMRGRSHVEQRLRTRRAPLRGEVRVIPAYRRLLFAARLRGDPNLLLKLFKDIPMADVEALLPHAEVSMRWFDRLMVLGSGAGAVGSTGMKIVTLITSAIYWTKLLSVLAVGAFLLAFRTILGYRRNRQERDAQRTRHLYFQNLDNNSGVIHALTAMIAEEEAKEAMLAYAACLAEELAQLGPAVAPAACAGEPADRVAQRVEAYLARRFGVRVAFDARDACATLTRLGLWEDPPALRVRAPAWALIQLHNHAETRRTDSYHTTAVMSARV